MNNLINVEGCFHCKKLVGNLRDDKQTKIVDGYEQCAGCGADIDWFWLNVQSMKFQEFRPITKSMLEKNMKFFREHDVLELLD